MENERNKLITCILLTCLSLVLQVYMSAYGVRGDNTGIWNKKRIDFPCNRIFFSQSTFATYSSEQFLQHGGKSRQLLQKLENAKLYFF